MAPESFAMGKNDYKCFIEGTRGEKIVFYRWKEDKLKLNMAKLVGSTNVDGQNNQFYIKSVEECVTFSQDFSSRRAMKLDNKTAY